MLNKLSLQIYPFTCFSLLSSIGACKSSLQFCLYKRWLVDKETTHPNNELPKLKRLPKSRVKEEK